MPRDLPRLASMVFNTPLMMDRGRLDTTLAVIGPRLLDGLDIEAAADDKPRREAIVGAHKYFRSGGYLSEDGIAVLPILGTTARRASWLDAMCGMTSYAAIQDAITEMMGDPSVRGIMLEVDSPGGEAGGVFDLSGFIVAASEATGKPVWAHANELAASAGYAIASSAESIWVAQTGEVGSIGVVAAHIDVSEADKKAGVKWTYIHAGEKKVDGNPHEKLSEQAETDIQDDVDALYDSFVELVSLNRGVATAKIRDTKAGIFRGAKAVEAELADEVGTFDEALQAFAEHIDEMQTSGRNAASLSKVRSQMMAGTQTRTRTRGAAKPETESDKDKETGAEDEDEVETGAEVPAEDDEEPKGKGGKKAEGDDEEEEEAKKKAAAALSEVSADAKTERERAAGLATVSKQAERLGVAFDLSKAIGSGMSVSAARETVLNAAADADAGRETVTAQGHQPEKVAGGYKNEKVRAAFAKGIKGRGKR